MYGFIALLAIFGAARAQTIYPLTFTDFEGGTLDPWDRCCTPGGTEPSSTRFSSAVGALSVTTTDVFEGTYSARCESDGTGCSMSICLDVSAVPVYEAVTYFQCYAEFDYFTYETTFEPPKFTFDSYMLIQFDNGPIPSFTEGTGSTVFESTDCTGYGAASTSFGGLIFPQGSYETFSRERVMNNFPLTRSVEFVYILSNEGFAATLFADNITTAFVVDQLETLCQVGEVGTPGNCTTCPSNSYCTIDDCHNTFMFDCPVNSVSAEGSSTLDDCTCATGFTGPAGGPCVAAGGTDEGSSGAWTGDESAGGTVQDNGDGTANVGCSDGMLGAGGASAEYDVDVSAYAVAIDAGVVPVQVFARVIINTVGDKDVITLNFRYLGGSGEDLGTALPEAVTIDAEYATAQIALSAAGKIPVNTRTIQLQVNTICLSFRKRMEETNVTVGDISVIVQPSQVTGDPHFVGFDGSRYNFDGEDGHFYSLISDVLFQAIIKVTRGVVRALDGTWITEVGIVTENLKVLLTTSGLVVNGNNIAHDAELNLAAESRVEFLTNNDGSPAFLIVETSGYHLHIAIQTDGKFKYFDIKTSIVAMPVNPHGLLGQTARFFVDGTAPNPEMVTSKNAAGFIEGSPSDYEVKSLDGTECHLCTFHTEQKTDRSTLERPLNAFVF